MSEQKIEETLPRTLYARRAEAALATALSDMKDAKKARIPL